jgi:hypothetical protein
VFGEEVGMFLFSFGDFAEELSIDALSGEEAGDESL